jgi:hypothetical protein
MEVSMRALVWWSLILWTALIYLLALHGLLSLWPQIPGLLPILP